MARLASLRVDSQTCLRKRAQSLSNHLSKAVFRSAETVFSVAKHEACRKGYQTCSQISAYLGATLVSRHVHEHEGRTLLSQAEYLSMRCASSNHDLDLVERTT